MIDYLLGIANGVGFAATAYSIYLDVTDDGQITLLTGFIIGLNLFAFVMNILSIVQG